MNCPAASIKALKWKDFTGQDTFYFISRELRLSDWADEVDLEFGEPQTISSRKLEIVPIW